VNIANRDSLAFVAYAVHHDDPAIFHEKPQHAGVELSHVTQFKQPIAKRPGQRLPVILTMPQFYQTSDHGSEVIRVTALQLVQKLLHRARPTRRLIKLYAEIHGDATSLLMLFRREKLPARTLSNIALIGLFRKLDSIATPCSVKAVGVDRRRPPQLEVTDCDFKKPASSAVSRNHGCPNVEGIRSE
jgi:hypothetical protein